MHAVPVVRDDSFLTLHYRIALISEEAIDSAVVDTFEDRPATLQMGSGQLAPSLEARLIGLHEGDKARFDLLPGEAYGDRNAELLQKVSRAQFDGAQDGVAAFEPGDWVEFPTPAGAPRGRFAGVLKELNDQYALFDFNHPLAGQPIRFDVEIIGVL